MPLCDLNDWKNIQPVLQGAEGRYSWFFGMKQIGRLTQQHFHDPVPWSEGQYKEQNMPCV